MHKSITLFFLLLMLSSFGQQKDILEKYLFDKILIKASAAATVGDTAKQNLYYNYFFKSNPPDSLKCWAYYDQAVYSYEYTDKSIDYSISLLLKGLHYSKNQPNNQALCLYGLAHYYAAKNDLEKAMHYLTKFKDVLNSGKLTQYNSLMQKNGGYSIYMVLGDSK